MAWLMGADAVEQYELQYCVYHVLAVLLQLQSIKKLCQSLPAGWDNCYDNWGNNKIYGITCKVSFLHLFLEIGPKRSQQRSQQILPGSAGSKEYDE